MNKWYLFSVWGSYQAGNRNGCLEEFNAFVEAAKGIADLLKDHPDAVFKLVEGKEVVRG